MQIGYRITVLFTNCKTIIPRVEKNFTLHMNIKLLSIKLILPAEIVTSTCFYICMYLHLLPHSCCLITATIVSIMTLTGGGAASYTHTYTGEGVQKPHILTVPLLTSDWSSLSPISVHSTTRGWGEKVIVNIFKLLKCSVVRYK